MLEKLINAEGISGYEMGVRQLIMKEMKGCADRVWIDKIGNLIAHKKGRGPTVMLAAHMDEVGLMVKHIEEDGRIMFSAVGGVDPASVISQRVRIKDILGVITTKEISKGSSIDDLPQRDDIYIDCGLDKKELAGKGIRTGTYISFDQCDFCKGGSGDVIIGKALDDRIGCYALLELAKRLKKAKNEIYYVFTVQEEIGLYGAKISAYKIEPDWAIAVDVTDDDGKSRVMGRGPCITVKDSEMIGNPCINGWLEMIAKRKKIPIQFDVSDGGTTDALSISISKEGTPTGVVGVAVRNMHTPTSMANLQDVKDLVRLLEALLKNPPKVCLV